MQIFPPSTMGPGLDPEAPEVAVLALSLALTLPPPISLSALLFWQKLCSVNTQPLILPTIAFPLYLQLSHVLLGPDSTSWLLSWRSNLYSYSSQYLLVQIPKRGIWVTQLSSQQVTVSWSGLDWRPLDQVSLLLQSTYREYRGEKRGSRHVMHNSVAQGMWAE